MWTTSAVTGSSENKSAWTKIERRSKEAKKE